jgi:proteasome lid subunit RPN8/RPN11
MDREMATFVLPFRERRRLHQRAFRAQQKGHREVCGALLAHSGGLLRLVFLQNGAVGPYRFSIARADLRRVREGVRSSEERVIGTFHSHPIGTAQPGRRDRRSCGSRMHMLIYDVCGRESRLWRVQRNGMRLRSHEVPLQFGRNEESCRHW